MSFDSKEPVSSPLGALLFFSSLFSLLSSLIIDLPPVTILLLLVPFDHPSFPYTMSFASSGPVGSLLDVMDRQYIYIGGTAFLVCGLVAIVLLLSARKQKIDYNSGVFTYLKFIYASFLKPHEKGEGQQDALESFYRAQV